MQRTSSTPWTIRTLAAAGFGLLLSLIAIEARADLIPPDVSDCTGKKAGDPCTQGRVCTQAECKRLDYANWDRDASSLGPPSVAYACVKCLAPTDAGAGDASASDAAIADAGATEAGVVTSPAPPVQADASGPRPVADAAATPEASTATEAGPAVHDAKAPTLTESEPDEKSDSGCAVGGGTSSGAAWLTALLGACLLGRRRKTA